MLSTHLFSDKSRPDTSKLSNEKFTHIKYKFEQGGLLVYDLKAESHFSDIIPNNSPSNLSPNSKPSDYVLEVPEDNATLKFNSKFECGNLLKAIKLNDYEYDLYLKCDTNSPNHNHWYYFSVFNPRKTSITFKICNMKKSDPLYALGMKPSTWSCKSKELENIEWHRSCSNISHTQNVSGTYTLKFTYHYKYPNDTVYFAYSIPYSYSDLSLYLSNIKQNYSNICRINLLCETTGKLSCEFITITDSISDYLSFETEQKEMNKFSKKIQRTNNKKLLEKHQNKKGIVLMGRIHSGETVSSFMLMGAIDFLLSACKKAEILRKNFVFKIVPMLNPDGVYAGNYRCCLNGVDLNRKWLKPEKINFPTVYYAKIMILNFAARHPVSMICDFHGHTRKKNVFMYGCSVKPETYQEIRNNLLARVVPYFMSRKNSFFSFRSSHYRVEKYKESTSRIVFFKELQIPHSYTVESSFFGADTSTLHFSPEDLATIGQDLCKFCIAFVKNPYYLSIINSTNNYLQTIKSKNTFLKKFVKEIVEDVKNSEERLEKNSEKDEEKIVEEGKKEVSIEENEKVFENSHSDQEENSQDIDETKFWKEVELVKCMPDEDSSGSDSDASEKEECDKIKQNLLCIPLNELPISTHTPTEKLHKSQETTKITKTREQFIRKKGRISGKIKIVSMSADKKMNEMINLQTFNFPDAENEKKSGKLFEPLRASVNLKNFQKSPRSPTNTNRSSLSFLPALVAVNKSYTQSRKKSKFQSFSGIVDQLSRFISQTSHFNSRK